MFLVTLRIGVTGGCTSRWNQPSLNPLFTVPVAFLFFTVYHHVDILGLNELLFSFSPVLELLIFEIRKTFVVDTPLGLIFDDPAISGIVKAVEALRNADLGLTYKEPITPPQNDFLDVPQKKPVTIIKYGKDYDQPLSKLRKSYVSLPSDFARESIAVFLTGAADFLGAFVLRDLLLRRERVKKLIYLVRASDCDKVLARLKEGSTDRGVWDDERVKAGRLEVLTGDLSLDNSCSAGEEWNRVAEETDAILHNGVLVHWVYPYEKLRAAIIISTLTAIELASTGKQMLFVFISSASAIDAGHYVHLTESLTDSNHQGVPDSFPFSFVGGKSCFAALICIQDCYLILSLT